MVNRMRVVSSLLTTAWLAACSSARPCTIESWGTMREVLREGHSEARVALAGLGGPGVVGVGALADLAGEVTIVDDRVLVARADGASCRVDMPRPDDHASLFVRAEVDAWLDFPLLDCASYEDLDRAIAARLAQLGRDPTMPSAVRIHGRATNVAFHVIAGSCPIANPDGPSPWRFQGPLDADRTRSASTSRTPRAG